MSDASVEAMNGPTFFDVNSVRLAVWERPGNGTPILFAHATGFHARCWNQTISRLPGRHCYAVDLRGHGESSKSDPPYYWSQFGRDIAALAHRAGWSGLVGAGHSMGGHSLTTASILAPDLFASLLLIDPVIMPSQFYGSAPAAPHYARKRRARWKSWQEMMEKFQDRPPFREWDPAVLQDYCQFGLLPAPDGDDFVLACPPDVEGSVYESCGLSEANLWNRLPEVSCPVTVVRAARAMSLDGPVRDMAASPTAVDLAFSFPHGRDLHTTHSHFIPMENPGLIADLLAGPI